MRLRSSMKRHRVCLGINHSFYKRSTDSDSPPRALRDDERIPFLQEDVRCRNQMAYSLHSLFCREDPCRKRIAKRIAPRIVDGCGTLCECAHPNTMKVLGISGSLRAESTNKILLHALALLASPDLTIEILEGLGQVPAFNPDLEMAEEPEPVLKLRTALREADLVVVASPEYAHGVPGVLKNALDWVVGSGELSGMPVVLAHAAARGEHANASLREILTTMDALLLRDEELTIDLMGRSVTASEISGDDTMALTIKSHLNQWSRILKAERYRPSPRQSTAG
jgi:chromate reductase, NAD(P)H dehydrogenase (quinone)